jgi:hypothetical protein
MAQTVYTHVSKCKNDKKRNVLYNVPNISYMNLPYPLIPGTVSTGIIFAFTYMCMHYLHHIHPPTHFPATIPCPPVPTAPSSKKEKT